jgi:hypothetical protein
MIWNLSREWRPFVFLSFSSRLCVVLPNYNAGVSFLFLLEGGRTASNVRAADNHPPALILCVLASLREPFLVFYETLARLLGDNEEPHAKALRRKGVFEKNDLESIAGVATIRFSFIFFAPLRLCVRFCPITMLKSLVNERLKYESEAGWMSHPKAQ